MITENQENLDEIIGGKVFVLVRKIKKMDKLLQINVCCEKSGRQIGMLKILSRETAKTLKKMVIEKRGLNVGYAELSKYYLMYNNEKIDDTFKLSALKTGEKVSFGNYCNHSNSTNSNNFIVNHKQIKHRPFNRWPSPDFNRATNLN